MLHTTFRKAKEAGACVPSYRKMAKALGGVNKYGENTPIPLDKVLEVCGLDDALWALRIITEQAERGIRLFACDCAERVLPLFEKKYPLDNRPRTAIDVVRRFANGEASPEELEAAAEAAARAARAAARAAEAAARAAEAAGWAAAWAAAGAAGAARAAWAAWAAAEAAKAAVGWAAGAAAEAVEREWQTNYLMKLLGEGGERRK